MNSIVLTLAVIAFAPLSICLAKTKGEHFVPVVDYFAGKDEDCLAMGASGVIEGVKKPLKTIKGSVKQIISITDFHSPTDSERHCTVSIAAGPKQSRFSASPQKCDAVGKLAGKGDVSLKVSGNHVCEVESP